MISIRALLYRHLAPGLSLLLLGNGLLISRAVGLHLRRQFDDALLAGARSFATMTEATPSGPRTEFQEAGAAIPNLGLPGMVFQLSFDDGAVVLSSPRLGWGALRVSAMRGPGPVYFDATLPGGNPGRFVALRFSPAIDEEDRKASAVVPRRPVVLLLGASRARLDSSLHFLDLMLVASVLSLLGATLLLVRRGLRRGLAPLAALVADLREIDVDRLGPPVDPTRTPKELRPVVEQLNALLARLSASFERERSFSAHLAHELLTPVSELRILSEVALQDPTDLGVVRPLLEDACATARQMQRIVDDLLTLARLEGPDGSAQLAEVAPADLILSAWRSLHREAGGRGMDLILEGFEGVAILSDASKLELAIGNLLHNAVWHGVAGSPVRCQLWRQQGGFSLRVENRAEGLSPGALAHIFDRFSRGDPARTGSRHAGLGLALVAAICKHLGLTCQASLEGEGVFSVTVSGLEAA